MKIPKTVKIGGHIYDVAIQAREKENGVNKLGSSSVYQNKIWLTNEQPQSQMESTFFHEIIEVISALNKLELSEDKICILENQLYQVLKDNNLLK